MWLQSVKSRFLATVVTLIGLTVLVAPGVQAHSSDVVDRAVKAKLAQATPPDVVERAVGAALRRQPGMPDVIERAVAAKLAARTPKDASVTRIPASSSRFQWVEFGLGAGVAAGVLVVVGAAAAIGFGWRRGRLRSA